MTELVVRYLSHPQVIVEENVAPADWALSEIGEERVKQIADRDWLKTTALIVTSGERKAIQTGGLIAAHLRLAIEVRPRTGEIDRSSTGFLPVREFSDMMDRFFTEPNKRAGGWESATDAQNRIVGEIEAISNLEVPGDILIVGHGTVGALLLCHLAKATITRTYAQSPGGGNYFAFTRSGMTLLHSWRPIEEHSADCGDL